MANLLAPAGRPAALVHQRRAGREATRAGPWRGGCVASSATVPVASKAAVPPRGHPPAPSAPRCHPQHLLQPQRAQPEHLPPPYSPVGHSRLRTAATGTHRPRFLGKPIGRRLFSAASTAASPPRERASGERVPPRPQSLCPALLEAGSPEENTSFKSARKPKGVFRALAKKNPGAAAHRLTASKPPRVTRSGRSIAPQRAASVSPGRASRRHHAALGTPGPLIPTPVRIFTPRPAALNRSLSIGGLKDTSRQQRSTGIARLRAGAKENIFPSSSSSAGHYLREQGKHRRGKKNPIYFGIPIEKAPVPAAEW